MERQLVLIDLTDHAWHLDEETKQIGRKGVELAREALRHARIPALEEHHPTAA